MSIASELTLLNNTKQGIKTAINNKGVTVTSEPFAEYPDKILLIPKGTGVYESNIMAYVEGSIINADIPSGTTKIGSSSFFGCTMLKSVTLPSSITSIETWAFYGCYSLSSLTVNATNPPTLGSGAIPDNNSLKIYVPSSSVLAYQIADGWSDYANKIEAI